MGLCDGVRSVVFAGSVWSENVWWSEDVSWSWTFCGDVRSMLWLWELCGKRCTCADNAAKKPSALLATLSPLLTCRSGCHVNSIPNIYPHLLSLLRRRHFHGDFTKI
ncbi:hypothetical protein AVEN_23084-1, partial [Araneus ventricosus]